MDKVFEDIFSKKMYKQPKVPEMMLNIINHQGNANKNHNEIPVHIH